MPEADQTIACPVRGPSGRRGLSKARVVCVDDDPGMLEVLRRMLRTQGDDWDIRAFDDGSTAWDYLQTSEADVVITDVAMPLVSGLELVKRLRANDSTRDTPIVMVTGLHDESLKHKALDLGATDLLNKPFHRDDLLARVRSALRLKECQDQLKRQNERLEHMVIERTRQLQASRIEIIWRLARTAEYRDEQTGNHVMRVAYYSRIIALALNQPRPFVETLFLAAPLHDLGKIAIPDAILHKPGRLTEEERKIVETHCEIGERILSDPHERQQYLLASAECSPGGFLNGGRDPVLKLAREIALSHHERWDGTGYPQRLAGEAIPLSARIVAVADVYDALTSERPYKKAFPPKESLNMIRREAGRHFSPAVADAFIRSWESAEEVRRRLSDGGRSASDQSAWDEFAKTPRDLDSHLVPLLAAVD